MRLLLLHIADGEAAVQRRCHIIGMALDFRSDTEKLILGIMVITQSVGCKQTGNNRTGAAAQTAGHRNAVEHLYLQTDALAVGYGVPHAQKASESQITAKRLQIICALAFYLQLEALLIGYFIAYFVIQIAGQAKGIKAGAAVS